MIKRNGEIKGYIIYVIKMVGPSIIKNILKHIILQHVRIDI